MTDRLYYNDPSSREFDAVVVRVAPRDAAHDVWLDRTAFYPTSGGQPFDTGTLGGVRVQEVVEDEAGDVVHTIAGDGAAALRPGDRVHGVIAWPRRFDHMQQHTGQHVLSAAFDHLFRIRTVSFHLGSETSTIDLAREASAREIAGAEDEANRVVWEDRAVSIRYATPDEAARLPLRKEPVREGTLRLIDVDGFDLSACGGTHVARTGAIGVIAVTAWERFKGGQRLEFVCGGRALARFRLLRESTAASVRLLSVLPAELPGAIERLQTEAREQKRTTAALETALARVRAAELAAEAVPHRSGRLLLRLVDGDANTLKTIATTITSAPGFTVVLVSGGSPALVVVARSSDVPLSAADVIAALTKRFGGRGGGRPELAQAGGLAADAGAVLTIARETVGD